LQIVDILEGGGAERVVVDLAKHIDHDKYALSVCATREPGVYASELEQDGIPVYCLHRKARWDPFGFARLLKLIHLTRPEIVHTHKVGSNTLGRAAAVLCRVPVIISHEHSPADRGVVSIIVDRILAKKTKFIITCDRALRDALIARERLDERHVVTVYNGVELGKFDNASRDFKDLRNELRFPDGAIIGTTSRLAEVKDLPNLLEAVPFVLEKMPDTSFLIAGTGPLKDRLETIVNEKGLNSKVRFLGYRTDIPILLATFDVFVLSSMWEGFPVSALEAMAAGKPVVSTNVGGVSEVVDHGINGLLVPPHQPRELANALIKLLKDPKRAKEMGERGRNKIEKEYSIELMAAKVEGLYSLALSHDENSLWADKFRR
jgi:glycosyltransferase involved in cell wall biosynthesis